MTHLGYVVIVAQNEKAWLIPNVQDYRHHTGEREDLYSVLEVENNRQYGTGFGQECRRESRQKNNVIEALGGNNIVICLLKG